MMKPGLTLREARVLAMAAETEGPLLTKRVTAGLGKTRAWFVLNRLRKRKAMEHLSYQRWLITDEGRAALAKYEALHA
jgi:hypothetical protein